MQKQFFIVARGKHARKLYTVANNLRFIGLCARCPEVLDRLGTLGLNLVSLLQRKLL